MVPAPGLQQGFNPNLASHSFVNGTGAQGPSWASQARIGTTMNLPQQPQGPAWVPHPHYGGAFNPFTPQQPMMHPYGGNNQFMNSLYGSQTNGLPQNFLFGGGLVGGAPSMGQQGGSPFMQGMYGGMGHGPFSPAFLI
jgi:hypothetical protein